MSPGGQPVFEQQRAARGFALTPAVELMVFALAASIALATYLVLTRTGDPQKLLTPPLVALLLVANLLPSVSLLGLLGRRVAMRRAAASPLGGHGRLHVRLVALFSGLAMVPTVLAVIFASLMFQYGVEFWLSKRVSAMLENAASLAQESYQETLKRWSDEVTTMAGDISLFVRDRPVQDRRFVEYLSQQLYYRSLSEGAIFTASDKNVIHFIARIDPYGGLERQIDPVALNAIRSGAPTIVTVQGSRVRVLTLLPGSTQFYLYAAKVTAGRIGTDQIKRSDAVLSDYRTLRERARSLQLQFNGALLIVALLIVGIAVWIALAVADRLVRPVGELVGAARRVEKGDLTARVPATRERDEIGTLGNAFNQMTARLEEQTGELVSANTQLESRTALIEAVMTGVTAGVLSIGPDRRVRLANSSAINLLRSGAGGAVGRALVEVSPELDQLLDGEDAEAIIEVAAGGEPRTLAVKVAREADEKAGGGYVLTFDDITQQQLDQRRAAWSDVARRIAHEIKNPLTPIQLAAERLQRRYGAKIDADDGTFARLTETIIRQVGDLRRMVDEFSSFARMPKPVFRAESLVEIGRQALFLHEVAHPGVAFALVHDDPVPPLVCDRRQIGQALTNIVKNAVEAVAGKGEGTGGEVTMTLRGDAREVSVEVADNGVGLPPDRDRIVEPYMTTRARGTGLGLAIVKKIVEEHIGTIAFADRPGGGTCVTMTFDAAALRSLDSGPDPAEETRRYDRPTILTQNRSG